MKHKFRPTAAAYLVGDLLALAAAFFGAWALRFQIQVIPLIKNPAELDQYLPLLPVILISWPVVLYFHGLYQMRRARSRVDEALTILLAVVLASVLLLA
ncbi:MAG: hypothetical protein KDD47_14410, partial [Acidobacteria bacterium]|nr:hypothetical protein [Acidobacteriota bacterium]